MATLHFKGKSAVWNHHLSVPYQTLDPVAKMSHKGKDDEENLIIEGDNLIALKALLPKYQGKIKCIYIDPPYNTGNEGWVYSDNVSNPIIKSWIGETVGKEGEDLTRHDKWLCMMTPRMKLLRELLTDDGVIFVSIDDNEVHHLKCLLNDIYGPENFIAELPTVMNLKGNQDQFGFAGTHEYTLVFSKNKNLISQLNEFPLDETEIDNWEEDEIGYFKKGAPLKRTGGDAPRSRRPNGWFPLFISKDIQRVSVERKDKDDTEIYPITDGQEMSWRWSKEKFKNESYNIIVNTSGGEISLYKKQRPSVGDLPSKKPKTLFYKPEYSSGNGTNQLKQLFGEKLFDNPKPVNLVKDFLTIASGENDIVLDSFAGSGTTAQAVLELNKEDGGNRKFILVQIPEETGKDSAAYKAGYKTVQEITQARVKKVIERDGLDTGFTYYKLGQQIDADGILSGELPSYDDFAKYVYYLATGKNYPSKSKVDEKKYFVGKDENTAVFLVYENDFEKLKSMALTLDLAKDLHKQHDGRKIVYAPACFLDEYHLDQFNITFVGIPFNLFERN